MHTILMVYSSCSYTYHSILYKYFSISNKKKCKLVSNLNIHVKHKFYKNAMLFFFKLHENRKKIKYWSAMTTCLEKQHNFKSIDMSLN